jgi:phenylacetate-CoA ligase
MAVELKPLEFYQRLSRPELEALQFAKLKAQAERLWRSNPFYRERWAAAKVSPEDLRRPDDLRRFPAVRKADFVADQAAAPPFGRRLGVPVEDVRLVAMTSGTSGQGQEIYGRTEADLVQVGYRHWLPFQLAGLKRGDLIVNCTPSGGVTAGGWGPPQGWRHGGCPAFHLGGVMSTDAKVEFLRKLEGLKAIYSSTHYVYTLTDSCRRLGFDPKVELPELKCIVFAAEGYPPQWIERMREFWGCPLYEGYGSTQCIGYTHAQAAACRDKTASGRDLMLALEWLNVYEILDPETGEPVPEGEEGELVLTNLDVEGSPVFRFRMGDRVRRIGHRANSLGWPFEAIETGGIGRYDDMLKIRGNNVWPSAVDDVVRAFPEVVEYVGVVDVDERARTDVVLRVALNARLSAEACDALFAKIAERVKAKTNVLMRIEEIDRAALPQFAYKTRRWTDRRKDGYARGA